MKKLIFFSIVVALALFVRVVYLQLYRGDEYGDWSRRITLKHIPLLAPRGVILDRTHTVLAENRAIFEASANREEVETPHFDAWAETFGVDAETLRSVWRAAKSVPSYRPLVLKDNLSQGEVLAWRRGKLDDVLRHTDVWTGIDVRYRPTRVYPIGEAFSHVLGYVRPVTDDDLEKNPRLIPEDLIGSLGVEEAFDEALRGKDGDVWKWVDAHGREMESKDKPELSPGETAAVPGENLELTIDRRLQAFAYSEFQGRTGALVALHLPDGEILSMVSSPGFKTNAFVGGVSSRYWRSLLSDPARPLLNRAVSGLYPPGSTYKIVTAAAALEAGVVTAETESYCPGYFMYGSHRFGCWNKRGHGSVALVQALERSCDVYFYRIGLKLGVDTLAAMSKRFGFASRSGLGFRAENAGFIPTEEGLWKRYKKKWGKGDIFPVAIGQGSNSVTPLQSALMIARIATNNAALAPSIVKDKAAKPYSPLLSEKTHGLIASGLKAVVYGGGGTAGRLRNLPFTLAGKTGTAQAGGNHEDHAWFVAYAPAEDPQIAVSVLVEHGGHGGAVAGPIAAAYLTKYFELYPSP